MFQNTVSGYIYTQLM